MSLRERLLDDLIDGEIGNGIIVTRQEMIDHFSTDPESYTGVFLSNSEISRSHSQDYEYFTIRVSPGRYRIHPEAILQRMKERGML